MCTLASVRHQALCGAKSSTAACTVHSTVSEHINWGVMQSSDCALASAAAVLVTGTSRADHIRVR